MVNIISKSVAQNPATSGMFQNLLHSPVNDVLNIGRFVYSLSLILSVGTISNVQLLELVRQLVPFVTMK